MGLGVLEDRVMEHVPGLRASRELSDAILTWLRDNTILRWSRQTSSCRRGKPGPKCDRSGPVPIILVPQPSDDPNDPLVRLHVPQYCITTLMVVRTGHSGSATLSSVFLPSFRYSQRVSVLFSQPILNSSQYGNLIQPLVVLYISRDTIY
jgi:hypothetical protein